MEFHREQIAVETDVRKNAIKNCYRVLIVMLNSISPTEQWAIYSYYLLFFTLNFTSLASICYVFIFKLKWHQRLDRKAIQSYYDISLNSLNTTEKVEEQRR